VGQPAVRLKRAAHYGKTRLDKLPQSKAFVVFGRRRQRQATLWEKAKGSLTCCRLIAIPAGTMKG